MFDQSPEKAHRPQRSLPTFYYHRHFLELLDFIDTHYRHVLTPAHVALNRTFRRLDPSPQRLYVRLVNRKGRIFARNRLRYPEIGDLNDALDDLRAQDWIGSPGGEFFEDVLAFLTKDEICAGLAVWFPGIRRSLRKAELTEFAMTNCDPEEFMSRVSLGRVLVQRQSEWVAFLLFLYFGECRDSLSRFTLRDMGLVRTHSFREVYEPRFADREEALQTFYYSSRLRRYERGSEYDRTTVATTIGEWPQPAYEGAAGLRDRLAFAIGRDLEREGKPDEARQVYELGDSTGCTERGIRLLLAAGDRDDARRRLEACLKNPRSEDERLLASDLLARKFGKKRTSVVTDTLRAASTIELDESHAGSAERGAIAHFEERGARAWRAENTLWRTLFGLLFWDELFPPGQAAVHSPFEDAPGSLGDGSFYRDNEVAIEGRLAALADAASTKRHLLKISTQHFGTSNGIFRWRRSMAEVVFALIDHADPGAVAAMLRIMCRCYGSTRDGFPDLLVVDDGKARLVEIKAQGDQIRRNQMNRLQQLREAGLDAEVVRVRWILDPDQTYVVVDVETTGGRGEAHRITELAAVKLRGDRVIDKFQSLVNPLRSIPRGITRLTGITEEMVAGRAPFCRSRRGLRGVHGRRDLCRPQRQFRLRFRVP